MTDDEFREYVGQFVEVRFVDGRTAVGQLLEGEALLLRRPHQYGLEIAPANVTDGPTWLGIPSAAVVESIRVLERPPEIID
jgi:hypothetical protein